MNIRCNYKSLYTKTLLHIRLISYFSYSTKSHLAHSISGSIYIQLQLKFAVIPSLNGVINLL